MSWVCLTFVIGLVKLKVVIRVIMLILLGNDHHNPIGQTVWRMGGWMLIVKKNFLKNKTIIICSLSLKTGCLLKLWLLNLISISKITISK